MVISNNDEKEGQRDFYNAFLPRVDKNLTKEEILNDYTDGIVNGNILEFKRNINDLNAVLFQAIKYLSAMRIKGHPVPANILLVSLVDAKVYHYQSSDYLPQIETVYFGSASKENSGFVCKNYLEVLCYNQDKDAEKLIELLRTKCYTRIHINEDCIVGWASKYYRENSMARKEDFIGDEIGKHKIQGEIRKPTKFKDFIFPYKGASNEKFRYLMDRLNDELQKKNLGAFYTHPLYAEKSLELVREAISKVPEGNDYIILDRCAGTGNLELGMTDEELSHTIVSTLEYYEYKVLLETLGDKVRHIIPPTEREDTFNMGLVRGADALSEEYIENEIIKQYIDNQSCTIILFENPPYVETTSLEHQRKKKSSKSSSWKKSYVVAEMRKEVKGTALNDLGNAFIWSAFKYYLRQPTDCYIVYSPVKYWKAQHLINKNFVRGFAFNRHHFHTNINACIMCALWSNADSNIEKIDLIGLDIDKKSNLVPVKKLLPVKRVHNSFSSKYYDKRDFEDSTYDGILVGLNGLEAETDVKRRIKPLYSKNMIGYLVADASGFDNPDAKSSLLVSGRYNGNGFYLHSDTYLEKLPMFAASRYIAYNRDWTERARIMKSADGYEHFRKDVRNQSLSSFLLKCLLFTCLEPQNHVREFVGSDGRYYKNQLTFDSTNGETLASRDVNTMVMNKQESSLLSQWERVLKNAKDTKGYNHSINYGLYQIRTELNTSHKDEINGENVFDYPELNGNIRTLAQMVKDYYNSEIVPILFQYEFLK